MAGDWEGRFRLWFEPGKLADDSVQRGSLRLVCGGRFLLHEYEGHCSGAPFQGVALWGYHLDDDAVECAWGESFGTGTSIMFCTGKVADGRFGARQLRRRRWRRALGLANGAVAARRRSPGHPHVQHHARRG